MGFTRIGPLAAASSNSAGTVLFAVLILLAILAYWTPFIVAVFRKVPNLAQVTVINFFLGWTFVGWVVALVMALKPKPVPYPPYGQPYPPPPPYAPPSYPPPPGPSTRP